MRCSVYIVFPSVLSCSNLKLHEKLEVKNILKSENLMLQLTFNPGLMLTGFRTMEFKLIYGFAFAARRPVNNAISPEALAKKNCPFSTIFGVPSFELRISHSNLNKLPYCYDWYILRSTFNLQTAKVEICISCPCGVKCTERLVNIYSFKE